MKQFTQALSVRTLDTILYVLIIALPFSTPFVVLLSRYANIFVISAWKEVLLLLATLCVITILLRYRDIAEYLFRQRLVQVTCLLLTIYVLYATFAWRGIETAAGFAIASRYPFAFLLALVVGMFYARSSTRALRAVTVLSLIISVFAVLQVTILPKDFLTNFGYDIPGVNTQGIPPAYHFVSSSEQFLRAQATLRGPNVFAAYLLLPFTYILYKVIKKTDFKNVMYLGVIAIGIIVSFSRSAWIAAAVSTITIFVLNFKNKKLSIRRSSLFLLAGFVSLILLGFSIAKIPQLHDIVFHGESGTSASNIGHINASRAGMREVISQPLGDGVGSAGPASVLEGSSDISENYYIQVAQEVGWLGLLVFIVLCIQVLIMLYSHRSNEKATILLGSFMGLCTSALFLHTWADESVALTWWIIAGLTIGAILNKRRISIEHQKSSETRKNYGQAPAQEAKT